jgi:hypothetical protein
MRGPFVFSNAFSNVGSNVGTMFKRLDAAPDPNTGDQVARFAVALDGSSGSAVLQLALVRNGEVIAYENATCTAASTRRTDLANGAGEYLSTVVFTSSGTDKVDLLGMDNRDGMQSKANTSPESNNKNCEWWFGITGLTTVTAASVSLAVSPKV